MGQTFKVFDPTTGQYVEKEVEGMTPVAEAVQEAAAPVVEGENLINASCKNPIGLVSSFLS